MVLAGLQEAADQSQDALNTGWASIKYVCCEFWQGYEEAVGQNVWATHLKTPCPVCAVYWLAPKVLKGITLLEKAVLCCGRAEKQRLAKLYEAFRRINAGGSSLDQLVTIILRAVRNLVNSDHNLLLFVDNSRDQLWTKWTLGTVMDNKVSSVSSFVCQVSPCCQGSPI